MIHGVHHDHPNDPRRLVLPPAFSIPLALLFLTAFVAAFGTPDAWAVAAGFYLGYVVYDTLHFALHHAVAEGADSGGASASCTCAITSRITSVGSA